MSLKPVRRSWTLSAHNFKEQRLFCECFIERSVFRRNFPVLDKTVKIRLNSDVWMCKFEKAKTVADSSMRLSTITFSVSSSAPPGIKALLRECAWKISNFLIRDSSRVSLVWKTFLHKIMDGANCSTRMADPFVVKIWKRTGRRKQKGMQTVLIMRTSEGDTVGLRRIQQKRNGAITLHSLLGFLLVLMDENDVRLKNELKWLASQKKIDLYLEMKLST